MEHQFQSNSQQLGFASSQPGQLTSAQMELANAIYVLYSSDKSEDRAQIQGQLTQISSKY